MFKNTAQLSLKFPFFPKSHLPYKLSSKASVILSSSRKKTTAFVVHKKNPFSEAINYL